MSQGRETNHQSPGSDNHGSVQFVECQVDPQNRRHCITHNYTSTVSQEKRVNDVSLISTRTSFRLNWFCTFVQSMRLHRQQAMKSSRTTQHSRSNERRPCVVNRQDPGYCVTHDFRPKSNLNVHKVSLSKRRFV